MYNSITFFLCVQMFAGMCVLFTIHNYKWTSIKVCLTNNNACMTDTQACILSFTCAAQQDK